MAAIAKRYEILGKTKLWTRADKAQLEEEIHTILEPKERELNEGKQIKLEKARNNKTLEKEPRQGSETYADVFKNTHSSEITTLEKQQSDKETIRSKKTPAYKKPVQRKGE